MKYFCGKSCSAIWRMDQPEIKAKIYTKEMKEKASLRLKEAWIQNPEIRKIVEARANSPENPFVKNKTENARKAHAKLKKHGYKYLNGGNGRGFTIAQALLLNLLKKQFQEYFWETELVFMSYLPEYQKGHHYQIDIANQILKLAIEVDGQSHQSPLVVARDRKKTKTLKASGWTVMRFKNKEIILNPQKVLWSITSKLKQITILQMAS